MNQSKPMGGTELMKDWLITKLEKKKTNLLKKTQILLFDEKPKINKKNILWLHDLPNDNRLQHLRDKQTLQKYEKIVFVSHWQQFLFNAYLHLPYGKGVVIQNSIDPISIHDKPKDGKINVCYFSTPHRGLEVLLNAWEILQNNKELRDKIELNIYSSFKIYNRPDREKEVEHLYAKAKKMNNVNYNETITNKQIRQMLKSQHIMSYPSIYEETSCLCLIEAMSSGCLSVIPNFGALPETSANFARMYGYQEDKTIHAEVHANVLKKAIENFWIKETQTHLQRQVDYFHNFYNWESRISEWEKLLKSI